MADDIVTRLRAYDADPITIAKWIVSVVEKGAPA